MFSPSLQKKKKKAFYRRNLPTDERAVDNRRRDTSRQTNIMGFCNFRQKKKRKLSNIKGRLITDGKVHRLYWGRCPLSSASENKSPTVLTMASLWRWRWIFVTYGVIDGHSIGNCWKLIPIEFTIGMPSVIN